jgi:hypothetical protein
MQNKLKVMNLIMKLVDLNLNNITNSKHGSIYKTHPEALYLIAHKVQQQQIKTDAIKISFGS